MLVIKTVLLLTGFLDAVAYFTGCPNNWKVHENFCYYIGHGTYDHLDARDQCRGMGAQLADLSSTEENDFVKNLISSTSIGSATGAWLDDSYNSRTGGWPSVWSGFSDWAVSPVPGADGMCKIMSKQYDWRWVAADCSTEQEMLYVCEMDIVLKDCTDDSCYLILTNSYEDHRTCQTDLGYPLARIESEEENTFVRNFFINASAALSKEIVYSEEFISFVAAYIGGDDKSEEGIWAFENGDEMTYFDWSEGEPNDALTGEDCIIIDIKRDYHWLDVRCDDQNYAHICEESA